MKQSQSIF